VAELAAGFGTVIFVTGDAPNKLPWATYQIVPEAFSVSTLYVTPRTVLFGPSKTEPIAFDNPGNCNLTSLH
jgi:hypothetical protein